MLRLSRVKVKRMFHYLSTAPLLPLGCSPGGEQDKHERVVDNWKHVAASASCASLVLGRRLFLTLGTPFALLVLRARSATFLRIPYAFLTHSLRRSHDFLACPLLT